MKTLYYRKNITIAVITKSITVAMKSFPLSTKGFFSIIINIRGRSLIRTSVYSFANYLLAARTSDLISFHQKI